MNFSSKPSFERTNWNEPVFEYVLSLGSFQNEKFSPGGACIIIADYLAITSKHIIEQDFRTFEEIDPLNGDTAPFCIQAIQIFNNGKDAAIWDIVKTYLSNTTDIAFLQLRPWNEQARNYKFNKRLILNFNAPEKNERLCAFGYRKPEVVPTYESTIVWKFEAMTSVGSTQEIHQKGFTTSKFPCIQTDAPWENMMSGGPIFNSKGELCAIISKSLWDDYKNQHIYSIGALLWPAMNTLLDMKKTGHFTSTQYYALDLCKSGHLNTVGWENIQILPGEVPGTETIQWRDLKKIHPE